MNVLGIHYGHDANVSYVKDGKCLFSISEERLSRVKFDKRWPQESLNYVMKEFNLSGEDIDYVAIIGKKKKIDTAGGSLKNYYNKFSYKSNFLIKILSVIINIVDNIFKFLNIRKKIVNKLIKKKLFKIGIDYNKVIFLDHHFCHAVGAFHASEFKKSLIITCDGKGDDKSHKSFLAHKDENGLSKLRLIAASRAIDSIGFFYSAVTQFLGFKPLRHEGKITGLAAYGEKNTQNIKSPVETSMDGFSLRNTLMKNERKSKFILFKNFIKLDFKLFFKSLINSSEIDIRYYELLLNNFLKKHFNGVSREHVARYAQDELENTISNLILNTIKMHDVENICLSGGVFANVKLNQVIKEKTNKNVFVMPGMDDGGLSIGAALYIYEIKSSLPVRENFDKIYFGPSYTEESILLNIKKFNFSFEKIENIEKKIAEKLFEEKIVGRFNESMEWGPRALGNRSILASPKDKNINQILNKRLNRTEFMPFAPIILDHKCDSYLHNYKDEFKTLEFMTMTLNVKEDKKNQIPAVTHVDNTARPQSVKKMKNESLYRVLEEYEKLSGIAALVNTSFNLHEEPIVCSPYDALRALEQGAVDYLAMGNYWIYKND